MSAPTLSFRTTPTSFVVTWPPKANVDSYKVQYKASSAAEYITAAGATSATFVAVSALQAGTTYAVIVSTISGKIATSYATGTTTLPALTVANFTKASLPLSNTASSALSVYNISTLSSSNTISKESIVKQILSTGDSILVKPTVLPVKTAKVANTGTSSKVSKNSCFYFPFDKSNVSAQSSSLMLRNSTNVSVAYNTAADSITVGVALYKQGDTFYMDGQRVTVSSA